MTCRHHSRFCGHRCLRFAASLLGFRLRAAKTETESREGQSSNVDGVPVRRSHGAPPSSGVRAPVSRPCQHRRRKNISSPSDAGKCGCVYKWHAGKRGVETERKNTNDFGARFCRPRSHKRMLLAAETPCPYSISGATASSHEPTFKAAGGSSEAAN
jgi:hypothetical protein